MTNVNGVIVEYCDVSGGESGLNLQNSEDITIMNLTVDGTNYGVRAGQGSGTNESTMTISNSNLKAQYPIWLRVGAPGTVIITGSTLTANEGGQNIRNDAGATVTINGAYYVTTEAELRAALANKDVKKIILGDDIKLTKHVNLNNNESLVLDGNGKTITAEYDETNRCGLYLASNNITIKNVTITGDSEVVGIDTKQGTEGFTIEDVTFENISIGFYANPTVKGTIKECSFKNLDIGIGYGAGAELTITDNDFNTIDKYLDIYGKDLDDSELEKILDKNNFDVPVKLVVQGTAIVVIKDEG